MIEIAIYLLLYFFRYILLTAALFGCCSQDSTNAARSFGYASDAQFELAVFHP